MNCLRFFGMDDFAQIGRMTLYEYDMRMKAYRLRQVDQEYGIHRQAWENWNVQAMKGKGKKKRVPVFKKFVQFFDYEKRIREVMGESREDSRNQGIARIMRAQKERRRTDGKL